MLYCQNIQKIITTVKRLKNSMDKKVSILYKLIAKIKEFYYDENTGIYLDKKTLLFSNTDIESKFLTTFYKDNLSLVRIGLLLSMVIIPLYIPLDYLVSKETFNNIVYGRIITVIILAFIFGWTFSRKYLKYTQITAIAIDVTLVTLMVSILLISYKNTIYYNIGYIPAMVLVIVITSFLYGYRFKNSVIVSLISTTILLYTIYFVTDNALITVFLLVFFYSMFLLISIVAYFNEAQRRKIFLQQIFENKLLRTIENIHKHTRESIEYASLIQEAVVSEEHEIKSFFQDSFVYWMPKDTVGGDIWLFNELRHEDECLLMYIDCTGHGVPGAFVTMIVKAVEREIVSNLKKNTEFDISPAMIMGHFNKTMKILLKQEDKNSLSNAGWDGGIIYYNRRTQILKFAGAETALFYTEVNGDFKTVEGNRYSVGYKKCDMNYEYKETVIEVEEGMKFYCTTDGFLDQNGGEKDFPFGKKRWTNIIKENYIYSMDKQKDIFINKMNQYESMIVDNERNDDMTVIGFEIGKKSDYIEKSIEEIIKYEGVMTQNVIATCLDNIETKISDISMMGNISTVTIEYCQNIMKYSKNEEINSRKIVPAGTIEIQCIDKEYYKIIATNIVSIEDKKRIEPKLEEIALLDKSGIKKRYRELRRSGQNTHEKGGGIGLYEIAKVSYQIEYSFIAINEDKYSFTMKSLVESKKSR